MHGRRKSARVLNSQTAEHRQLVPVLLLNPCNAVRSAVERGLCFGVQPRCEERGRSGGALGVCCGSQSRQAASAGGGGAAPRPPRAGEGVTPHGGCTPACSGSSEKRTPAARADDFFILSNGSRMWKA